MHADKHDRGPRRFWEKHASLTIVLVLLALLGLVIAMRP